MIVDKLLQVRSAEIKVLSKEIDPLSGLEPRRLAAHGDGYCAPLVRGAIAMPLAKGAGRTSPFPINRPSNA